MVLKSQPVNEMSILGLKLLHQERKISPDELSDFTGSFITGTAAEITPVASILDNNFEVCDMILDLSATYERGRKNFKRF